MAIAALGKAETLIARTMPIVKALSSTIEKVKLVGSRIVEEAEFTSIYKYVGPRTLVLLDYDHTIGKTVTTNGQTAALGSDPWFRKRVVHYTNLGKTDPVDHALMDWYGVQNLTLAAPVEETTPAVIRDLQERHMVMGLTTRSSSLAMPTHLQLQSMGIDLTLTAPNKKEILFLNPNEVKWRYGVLFTSGTDKGGSFDMFLNAVADVFPRDSFDSVIFINDRRPDLEQLQRKVDQMAIPYLGIRYSAMDNEISADDLAAADLKFEKIQEALRSDDTTSVKKRKVDDSEVSFSYYT